LGPPSQPEGAHSRGRFSLIAENDAREGYEYLAHRFARRASRAVRGAFGTVKDAAHAVQSDQPAALAQLLREWLEVPMS
jgi:pimeloyl-ACP methyl ester carboxylesterase